ncbi:MAG: ATP-binding cassette domain-containing protein, partial [Synechococcales cyanobacterium]
MTVPRFDKSALCGMGDRTTPEIIDQVDIVLFEGWFVGVLPIDPVISVKNLNHYYGKGILKKQILFDINLDVYSGEIVIMTGPSGSGKTTLLSLIGGLRSVQEGSLKFLGKELLAARQDQLVQIRRNIGYIFQAHNLLGFLTARQNVQMAV